MIYKNPIILSDYSDPDCIRVGDSYYMVASSFNHTPGVPVLKSENLVNWKLLGYVFNELPWSRFDSVCHGDGAWAPSIRMHNGKIYVIIPFPDEGIYVAETEDIESMAFSPLRCLIPGKGLIDPCPIWLLDKCYMVIGFAKSRIGFNSCLGLYEVSNDLTSCISDSYTIIFDGHNTQPTIEGPKFYTHGDYIYILAPAGSVKSGWQVALRSKSVYGPYEEKIIMLQNDSKINGPHQGALVDLPNNEYAFLHFQDKGPYGRIVHLQPVKWINDWPICGSIKDELLGGTPVDTEKYPIDKLSGYSIPYQDDFKGNTLSYMWQTPANMKKDWYSLDKGLTLYCKNDAIEKLDLLPNSFLTKLIFPSFTVKTKCVLHLEETEEAGFMYMGSEYSYVSVKKINNENHLRLILGGFHKEELILLDEIYTSDEIEFQMKYTYPDTYTLGFNGVYFKIKCSATPGRWIGGKYGIYAKGKKGYAVFEYFKVREIK